MWKVSSQQRSLNMTHAGLEDLGSDLDKSDGIGVRRTKDSLPRFKALKYYMTDGGVGYRGVLG